MIVLLLDARWPSMIPFELVGKLRGSLRFTDEVPVKVRWNLGDVIGAGSSEILVSTNHFDEDVVHALASGAELIEVPSLQEPAGQAVAVMSRALRRGEWEQTQTHESLLAYIDEEVAEFKEAVAEGEAEQLKGELADILLQVLFHAEIASRRGDFNFQDVAASFVEKLRWRSPYLFAPGEALVTIEEQERLWQQAKAEGH